MKKMLSIAVAMCFAASVSVAGQAAAVTDADLIGGKFVLRSVDGVAFASEPRPVIEFGDGLAIHGRVCNGFRGKGELIEGLLSIDGVISTRMLCIHNDLSLFETRFLRLVENGLNLSLDGDALIMKGIGVELVFDRVADKDALSGAKLEAALAGRKFVLAKVDGEDFKVDRQPFIEFGAGMKMTGSACNNFIAPGVLDGDTVKVENAAATMMMCVDNRLAKFEADFHALLREGAKIALDGKTLTLSGGDSVFVYEEE